MKSLQIQNTRLFMSKLLASDSFDNFLMESTELKTGINYTVDGHVNKDFYSEDEGDTLPEHDLISWGEIRGTIYNLIKGKRTPLAFKFILCTSSDCKDDLLKNAGEGGLENIVSSLVLMIKFANGSITLTTGAALSGFTLDKSYEKIWDDHIEALLDGMGISFEEQ